MAGMLTSRGLRVVTKDMRRDDVELSDGFAIEDDDEPDMDDPATQGCALKLIAELRHAGSMFNALTEVLWLVRSGHPYPEALVIALERASADR